MRFVLVSTHVDQTTGYSKVASNLLHEIAPHAKIYHFGFQRHPEHKNIRKVPNGVVAYDAAANEDPQEEGFGFNKIHEYLEMVNPDVVMIYNDPLIIYKFIDAMKYDKATSSYKLWVYLDQVYEGIAPPLIEKINACVERVFCFTQEWAEVYKKYGDGPTVSVLEHAVDLSVFAPISAQVRNDVRAKMNIPSNGILMLNANRNSQRKRLDLTIMGFVRFLARFPDIPLYLLFVTGLNPQNGAYYDVNRIYQTELECMGLSKETFATRVLCLDTTPPNSIRDSSINEIYRACDIGINTSDGEGFGLCQLEHLQTGAPQIVTDIPAFKTFMDETTTETINRNGRVYLSCGMPLGLWTPTYAPEDVGSAIERMVSTLSAKKEAIRPTHTSWKTACEPLVAAINTAKTG
jgi:glycosyltransferase involved in cell wall biosynthesis